MTGHSLPDLVFVTSNPNKVKEVRKILKEYGIEFEHLDLEYQEIQASSLHEIALASARYLCERVSRPFFIEDAGLFIGALSGFPGPYSSYVYKTIGNSGVLKLMEAVQQRASRFESVVAYAESIHDIAVFRGVVEGSISLEAKGEGWGFDPIFIPEGSDKTYAKMGTEAKQRLSHRSAALERFAAWFNKRGRNGFLRLSR